MNENDDRIIITLCDGFFSAESFIFQLTKTKKQLTINKTIEENYSILILTTVKGILLNQKYSNNFLKFRFLKVLNFIFNEYDEIYANCSI